MSWLGSLKVLSSVALLAFLGGCPADEPPADGGTEGEGEDIAEGEGEGEGEGEANVGPSVVATVPDNGAIDVPTNTAVSVTWSEPIDCNTVNGTVAFLQAPSLVTSTIDCNYDADNDIMSFLIVPSANLPADTQVTAAVFGDGTITDLAGTPMVGNFIWTFTTGAGADNTAPTLVNRFPDVGATGIATNASISASFSEPIDCASVTSSTAFMTGVQAALTCVNSPDGSVTLDPAADLPASSTVTVTLGAAIRDLANNTLGANVVWTFDTGTTSDITPPAPPNATTFPASPTLFASVPIGGDKDASEATNVEAERRLDGVVQQAFAQIASQSTGATWNADVTLGVGVNLFTLRSRDAAGNLSQTTSISITRDAAPVDIPVVTEITSPTTSNRQVIEGTKPAGTAILLNDVIVVPQDVSTEWNIDVTLVPGGNVLTFKARDGGGSESDDVVENIQYNEPARLVTGEVKVEFDVISNFTQLGDESQLNADGKTTDINHLGFAVWIEGPLTERSPGIAERCVYDDSPVFQRKHIRPVRTVASTTTEKKPRTGVGCDLNAKLPGPCNGWFAEPDGTEPNFMAALTASGRWASAPQPLAANTDRRDASGHYLGIVGAAFAFTASSMMFNTNQPRLMQAGGPLVDGVTMASVAAHHRKNFTPSLSCSPACSDDQHCVDTDTTFQNPQGGAVECRTALAGGFSTCTDDNGCGTYYDCNTTLGRCQDAYGTAVCRDGSLSVDVNGTPTCRSESLTDWRKRYSIRWDLTDVNDLKVRPGLYVVWLEIAMDGYNPGRETSEWLTRVPARDVETCWDDVSHNTLGAHRVVAVVNVDGSTADVQHEPERPIGRAVPTTCFGTGANAVPCTCGTAWPCPVRPGTAVGDVHLLDPTFRGNAGAMRVEYCPTGACP